MIRFLLILPAAILLWGCTGKEQRAVPRRPAYPRVEAFRDTVKEVRAGNYLLSVNACATVTEPREGWLDVSYPGYGAVLHLTATEAPTPESLAAAVDNRLQRMQLNAGDIPATQLQFANAARMSCTLLTARTGHTPLQFIAVGDRGLVSGAVSFSGPTTPVDSIAPIIKTLDSEMVNLLKSLRRAD